MQMGFGVRRRFWVMPLKILMVGAMLGAGLSAMADEALARKNTAIVVDAKSGKVLYSKAADARTPPASLTKMMTLYLLFDALEHHRLSLNSTITMSRHAAAQPPTKLGLKAGRSLSVRDAILAMVTLSANDVAVAVGEHLGGTESDFAKRMTATAHALGMSRTTFRTASGLPAPGQYTTAHDMSLLGRALQDRFPQYFHYFSTSTFVFNGRRYGNHNHLLGKVAGVNGIKTGYTRASGYNLVTSIDRSRRRVIAVVLGGKTGRARDRQMASLIDGYVSKATTGRRTASVVGVSPAKIAALIPTPPERPDRPDTLDTNEPITTASIVPVSDNVSGSQGDGGDDDTGSVDNSVTPTMVPAGWKIQIGATPNESSAEALLNRAAAKAGSVLASVSPYTEPVNVKGNTLYRARFAGFTSKHTARRACTYLTKLNFDCLAISD